MSRRPALALWRDRAGAAAVETALLLPALAALLLGGVELGRMAWTRATLTFAVQEAARCASVRKVACATPGQVQEVAVAKAVGIKVQPSDFQVTDAACGKQVSAEFAQDFIIYRLVEGFPPIRVRACRA
jgi:Flp pilus assembly protein TadG